MKQQRKQRTATFSKLPHINHTNVRDFFTRAEPSAPLFDTIKSCVLRFFESSLRRFLAFFSMAAACGSDIGSSLRFWYLSALCLFTVFRTLLNASEYFAPSPPSCIFLLKESMNICAN